MSPATTALPVSAPFARRHIGPSEDDVATMLGALGVPDLDALIALAVPGGIRTASGLDLGPGLAEEELLELARSVAADNQVWRSYIGTGYYGTVTPPVLLRNILEDPGWYTAYTPYQAEIAQGRLEMLLNFQTVVSDLTGLPIASASLLDEATAAAEAMAMSLRLRARGSDAVRYYVADHCHPQTLAVVQTRAEPLGIELVVGPFADAKLDETYFGALVQSPDTDGTLLDLRGFSAHAHGVGALVTVACDLLALTLTTPPGEMGADIAVGSSQRFGVPMGYGGPHAAFFSTREEFKRQCPGRMIGVSVDSEGRRALRMALQTREQHIRRDKATSNICTAQVLLAVVAAGYACYHGPEGLRRIAERVRWLTLQLEAGLREAGHEVHAAPRFDTVTFRPAGGADAVAAAAGRGFNLRRFEDGRVGVSLDETVRAEDVSELLSALGGDGLAWPATAGDPIPALPEWAARRSEFLTHEVFHRNRSETDMMRYLTRLRNSDLSLVHSMIPLGSCTMKLNAAAEMEAVTWPEFGAIHPFAPVEQAAGYRRIFDDLERWLADITGFDAVSLQPNAGSQGEYAGLLVIRAYHQGRGEGHRNVCLIPTSAHGTNPASAVMAGMRVIAVQCDKHGNIAVDDLKAKAAEHADNLAALMVTYPSTHGVFESAITEICQVVHDNGGQVYMDGANLNAMVGLCKPGEIGADVCHLNLHKTFCIPHGGGGPGMGPIGVSAHLAPFLPGHPVVRTGGEAAIGAISAAPWGSPSILPISWAYIAMMGGEGLTQAARVAILNANYIASRLEEHFPVLYRGESGYVAHECIIDLRDLKKTAGVTVDDVAKRLMDFGFHAPTMSWPVAGTLMIEPTESESIRELDRFCDAMIQIRAEIARVEAGEWPQDNNPLVNSPHTAERVTADSWDHPYSRQDAAYPLGWVRSGKFWPVVGRVDNTFGDRNFVCTCPSVEDLAE